MAEKLAKSPAVRKVLTISTIVQKPTAKGKLMWTITDENDDFYSVFNEMVRARLDEGATVAVMLEIAERGDKQYKNIVGIADNPVAAAGEVNVNELLPGGEPTSSMQIQTTKSPAAAPAPVAAPRPAEHRPLNVMTSMVDIRIAALHAATRLCAAGLITAAQVEFNCREFEKYIMGVGLNEHNSSSAGGLDEYIT